MAVIIDSRVSKRTKHPITYTITIGSEDADDIVQWASDRRNDATCLYVSDTGVAVSYVACGANAADLRSGWPIENEKRMGGSVVRLCGCVAKGERCPLPLEERHALIRDQIAAWRVEKDHSVSPKKEMQTS